MTRLVLEGGVETAALREAYADRPGYFGELMWERAELAEALAVCARRGWPVGTHAMGDRAVAVLLDAIGDAHEQAGPLPAGALVVEHGGLIAGQIDRAADGSAWISAGTDHPIGPLDPLRAVHGMTTRATPAGVLGPEHAIGRAEALRLHTVAGAQFLGPPATATLVSGAPADLAVYPADPATCPPQQLLDLSPAATVLDGQLTYQAG